jgi:hypothetical protein
MTQSDPSASGHKVGAIESLLRPSVDDVEAFLYRRRALIVHFSGSPPGVSSGVVNYYPDDLRYVIAGRARTGVCCSVVTPSDNFHGAGTRNALGCVGVVLELCAPESLMAISPSDCGSWVDSDGVRQCEMKDISITDLDDSLDLRSGHNEWVIADYRVLGILAVAPFEIWDPTLAVVTTGLADVIAAFPDQPIFTFAAGRVWRTIDPV